MTIELKNEVKTFLEHMANEHGLIITGIKDIHWHNMSYLNPDGELKISKLKVESFFSFDILDGN